MGDDDAVRLDVWLDVTCLFKTRSQAQTACKGGKVEVNGVRAKPHRCVSPGDELRISSPGGRRRMITVLGVAEQHLPKAQARALYEDHTPPPSPEEQEARRMLRLLGPSRRPKGSGMPKKKERRHLRRMKEEWDEHPDSS